MMTDATTVTNSATVIFAPMIYLDDNSSNVDSSRHRSRHSSSSSSSSNTLLPMTLPVVRRKMIGEHNHTGDDDDENEDTNDDQCTISNDPERRYNDYNNDSDNRSRSQRQLKTCNITQFICHHSFQSNIESSGNNTSVTTLQDQSKNNTNSNHTKTIDGASTPSSPNTTDTTTDAKQKDQQQQQQSSIVHYQYEIYYNPNLSLSTTIFPYMEEAILQYLVQSIPELKSCQNEQRSNRHRNNNYHRQQQQHNPKQLLRSRHNRRSTTLNSNNSSNLSSFSTTINGISSFPNDIGHPNYTTCISSAVTSDTASTMDRMNNNSNNVCTPIYGGVTVFYNSPFLDTNTTTTTTVASRNGHTENTTSIQQQQVQEIESIIRTNIQKAMEENIFIVPTSVDKVIYIQPSSSNNTDPPTISPPLPDSNQNHPSNTNSSSNISNSSSGSDGISNHWFGIIVLAVFIMLLLCCCIFCCQCFYGICRCRTKRQEDDEENHRQERRPRPIFRNRSSTTATNHPPNDIIDDIDDDIEPNQRNLVGGILPLPDDIEIPNNDNDYLYNNKLQKQFKNGSGGTTGSVTGWASLDSLALVHRTTNQSYDIHNDIETVLISTSDRTDSETDVSGGETHITTTESDNDQNILQISDTSFVIHNNRNGNDNVDSPKTVVNGNQNMVPNASTRFNTGFNDTLNVEDIPICTNKVELLSPNNKDSANVIDTDNRTSGSYHAAKINAVRVEGSHQTNDDGVGAIVELDEEMDLSDDEGEEAEEDEMDRLDRLAIQATIGRPPPYPTNIISTRMNKNHSISSGDLLDIIPTRSLSPTTISATASQSPSVLDRSVSVTNRSIVGSPTTCSQSTMPVSNIRRRESSRRWTYRSSGTSRQQQQQYPFDDNSTILSSVSERFMSGTKNSTTAANSSNAVVYTPDSFDEEILGIDASNDDHDTTIHYYSNQQLTLQQPTQEKQQQSQKVSSIVAINEEELDNNDDGDNNQDKDDDDFDDFIEHNYYDVNQQYYHKNIDDVVSLHQNESTTSDTEAEKKNHNNDQDYYASTNKAVQQYLQMS